MSHSHRSTVKKDHKPFKSKHATKGSLKNQTKGKVEKSNGVNTHVKHVSKLERKNTAAQLKSIKMAQSKQTRKLFDGNQGIPKVVVVIALTDDLDVKDIVKTMFNIEIESPSINNIKIDKFKSNLKIIVPDSNILNIMDSMKLADFVIFALSANEEVGKRGETILRAGIAQGIANSIGIIPNISVYPKKNLQLDVKQSLLSYFQHFFPTEEKLYSLEITGEFDNLIRFICQKFPKSVNWRDSRGWLIADDVEFIEESLVVSGIVRGVGFDSNRLIHLPGFGDFQVNKIEKITRVDTVEYIPTSPESLQELNDQEIDMADYEDTNVDMGVRMDGKTYFDDENDAPIRKFPLPKGTSDYQAKWLIDDVLEDASDIEEDYTQAQDEKMDEDTSNPMDYDDMTSYAPTEGGDDMNLDLSAEEEERQFQMYRDSAKDDLEYPDEIELHPSESGKERLSGYRGIKSVGNCNWDFDEYDIEAPSIWPRLLRIGNFKATRNKLQKEIITQAQVTIGSKVKIYLKAPKIIMESINPAIPFVLYGLLEHEHKLALVNWSFKTWEDYEEPIENKSTLIAQYGPRRQIIKPLFNQGSNNANNVHKSENFVHPNGSAIASAIAPVIFNNCPTIFFKHNENNEIEFVGQGTLENCDHKRIVIQRAVLTGHPVKIHKRVVTVRYMFFNTDDIEYFKSIPLFTKSGRTGFIKESLGTHGYFKANFDGKLTSQDIVAMSMYKRVWPEVSEAYSN